MWGLPVELWAAIRKRIARSKKVYLCARPFELMADVRICVTLQKLRIVAAKAAAL